VLLLVECRLIGLFRLFSSGCGLDVETREKEKRRFWLLDFRRAKA
jgi:hypothetical protein